MKIIEKEMQEEGKEYVYVAEFVGGFCKIGVSNNPIKRLREVSKRNQIPLKNYFLVEGYFKLEKYLHNHFEEKRRYSEWFDINFNNVKTYLENLNINVIESKAITIKKHHNHSSNEFEKDYMEAKIKCFLGADTYFIENIKHFINLPFYKNKIKEEYYDLEQAKKSYLENIIDIGEDYEEAYEEIKDFKNIYSFVLEYTEYSFLKNEISLAYFNNLIIYEDVLMYVLKIIKMYIEENSNKDKKVRISYIGLEDLESKIATFIEFTDTNNMTDKEVYAMVKAHIEK